MPKSPSYKRQCCNADCSYLDVLLDQPCWGEVDVVDEERIYDADGNVQDSYWVHSCQGHYKKLSDDTGPYEPELTP